MKYQVPRLLAKGGSYGTTAPRVPPRLPPHRHPPHPLIRRRLAVPFIGTTNSADDFPGADVPFGMVQWSPDTPSRPDGGGYEYRDSSITGFSLTHLSGPGCGAEGDVPVLPTVGPVSGTATDSFSHSGESADAGDYKVALANGVTTELTATTRTGMADFTFPSSTAANLIFKLDASQNGDSAARRAGPPSRTAPSGCSAATWTPPAAERSTACSSSCTPATAPPSAVARHVGRPAD